MCIRYFFRQITLGISIAVIAAVRLLPVLTVFLGAHLLSDSAFAQKGGKGGGTTPAPSLPAFELIYLPSVATADDPQRTNTLGVNRHNDVVGYCYANRRFNAVLWPAFNGVPTGTINLNSMINPTGGWALSYATAINDSGVIVGFGKFGQNSNAAYRLTPVPDTSGFWTVENLGGQLESENAGVNAVNSDGVAAGWYSTASNPGLRKAFIALPGGLELHLGQFDVRGNAEAFAINNEVEVTGYASIITSSGLAQDRAFRWTIETGLQNLGLLGGGEGGSSRGLAINNNGIIVGISSINRFDRHAFRCLPNAAMQSLGTLGGTYSEARGINTDGHIVGTARIKSGALRAFFYTDEHKMLNLDDLITDYPADLKGYLRPSAINDQGLISAKIEYPDGSEVSVALVRVK